MGLPGSVSFPVLQSCPFAATMGAKSHIKTNGKALPFSALTNAPRFRSSFSSLNCPENQSSLDQTSVPLFPDPALASQPPSSNFSSVSIVGVSSRLLLEPLCLMVVHSTLVFLYSLHHSWEFFWGEPDFTPAFTCKGAIWPRLLTSGFCSLGLDNTNISVPKWSTWFSFFGHQVSQCWLEQIAQRAVIKALESALEAGDLRLCPFLSRKWWVWIFIMSFQKTTYSTFTTYQTLC